LKLSTSRVAAGRPRLIVRSLDAQSGVDPATLTLSYRGELIGASDYDPVDGVAVFPLPSSMPALRPGTLRLRLVSSDFQESKNIDSEGANLLPNTRDVFVRLQVVNGPAVNWVAATACVKQRARLLVAASSTARVRSVRISVDNQRAKPATRGRGGLWGTNVADLARGRLHRVTAIVVDAKRRVATTRRIVPLCLR